MAPHLRIPSAAFLLFLCAQCANPGPPLQRTVTVQPGQLLRVSHLQANGPTLALQNASYSPAEDVYSDGGNNPSLKVVDDAEMQKLLDAFGGQGLFEHAAGAAAGGRETIVVQQGDRRWAWARPTPDSPSMESFANARQYFVVLYNSVTAYHHSEVGGRGFEAEQRRVQQAGAEARAKAQRQGPPK